MFNAGYTLLTVGLFIVALIVATQYLTHLSASNVSGNVPVASNQANIEHFENNNNGGAVEGAEEDIEDNANYDKVAPVAQNSGEGCFPRDSLTSADLLPSGANTKWSMNVPSGQGSIGDGNLLSSSFLFGNDTIGSSLRNPSYDLRSSIPNPQQEVGPWSQTTISPDLNRRPLE